MGLAQRVSAWAVGRVRPQETCTLTQRNLYILPTASGWAFAAMLLVMLVASINYQLSLGYGLTFLLAGCALVSIHLTHRTLLGLTLHLRAVSTVHAGEPASVEVVLANARGVRDSVGLHFHGMQGDEARVWCEVPALGEAAARLRLVPATRGLHPVPPIVVDTRFPFGLFRAWTVWRPAATLLAWPALEVPAPALPAAGDGDAEHTAARAGGGTEFEGVRAWRRGDTLRQVLWKKAARSGELVSRETSTAASRQGWLEWQASAAPGLSVEQRLSRLAAWVDLAERLGVPVGLRLPGQEWAPGLGDAHRRELLGALALWR
ncbi:MAG: hypothetical protein RI988_1036 [Pseudomonadota bacterium]|jgi:uncharacterized protein (DUF58 family)